MTEQQLQGIRHTPDVQRAIGVMLDTEKLNAKNPLFIEIGIDPSDLAPFGVHLVDGRPFHAKAANEVMLGWRIAQSLGVHAGSTLRVAGSHKQVVGVFSTGNVFGDNAGMFPLIPFQAYERQPNTLSLAFVQVRHGASISAVAKRVAHDNPSLTTIRSLADFGRADRNYQLVSAADTGATILAIVIGAVIVMNTLLLSLFERTREFGVLRSIGWTRRRLVGMVLGEACATGFVGLAAGTALGLRDHTGTRATPAARRHPASAVRGGHLRARPHHRDVRRAARRAVSRHPHRGVAAARRTPP